MEIEQPILNNYTKSENSSSELKNNLFPIFLKLEQFNLLIIGAGNIGLEKLNAILSNSPSTNIKIIGLKVDDRIRQLIKEYNNIILEEKHYHISDLDDADIVIAAVNDLELSTQIANDAKSKNKLINVADKPELCDFYLGSIVQKGNLKIAISTNGVSPTIAKRIKEVINNMIPDEIETVLQNMKRIRNGLNGDFANKVKQLNDITKVLVAKQSNLEVYTKPENKKYNRIVQWCLFGFLFLILGNAFLWLAPIHEIFSDIKSIPKYVDVNTFLIMLLTGFFAQMVDGSLGMGYGTISTTFLLAYGVNPAIVSSRVHSARVFSSGVSGYSHHRFGNTNKKLFTALLIPGVIGAVIGATCAFYGQRYASIVRIPLSFYTLYLGYFILRKAFKKKNSHDKVKRAGILASIGGFMDAFAGGGWGTLVTSTLIAKRKNPRYVIGSVCLAEFFVVLASSITFFIFLKSIPLADIAGLIIGGLLAAPIASRLVGKLPIKTMFIAVGTLVIITSLITLWRVLIK